MPLKKRSIWIAVPLLLCSFACFALMESRLFVFTMDDSFISFRYAQHLSEGHGLVWNPGEETPNEGYTSVLWVLVNGIFFTLRLDPLTASKVFGIGAIFVTACVCFLSVYRFSPERCSREQRLFSAALTSSFFLLSADLAAHAVSGMETALALLLHTLFFMLITAYVKNPRNISALLIGPLGLLCGLNRPEFNLSVVITLAVALIVSRSRKRLLYASLFYLVGGGLYFGWRLSWFELFFPLPFYIKQAGHEKLFRGIWPVLNYLSYILPLSPLLMYFAIGFKYFKYRCWLPACLGVLANIVYFLFPAHLMGLNFRFLFPIYPMLLIFAGLGMSALACLLSRRTRLFACVVILVSVAWGHANFLRWQDVGVANISYGEDLRDTHIAFGKFLAQFELQQPRTLAVDDAGAIPYYSGWHTIDSYGLNDRDIALARSRSAYSPELVLDRQPDLVLVISYRNQSFTTFDLFRLELMEASMASGYRKIGALRFHDEYYIWLMVRDASFAARLRTQLLRELPSFVP